MGTKLTIVCGSPGAGKSTHARGLALRSSACLLDIDTCTEKLVRVGLSQVGRDSDDRDSSYFKEHYREIIYDTLFGIARENLPHCDVIVVGPFTQELRNQDWLQKLKSNFPESKVEVHYVFCSSTVRRQRIKERGQARDRLKLESWNETLAYYGDESPPTFEHRYIDTTDW